MSFLSASKMWLPETKAHSKGREHHNTRPTAHLQHVPPMPKDISKEVEIHRILRWTKIWEEKYYVWDLRVDSKLIYLLIMSDFAVAWKRALPGPLHLKYRISTHRSPCDLHWPVSAMKRSWHGQYSSTALKRKHASQHEQQTLVHTGCVARTLGDSQPFKQIPSSEVLDLWWLRSQLIHVPHVDQLIHVSLRLLVQTAAAAASPC